MGFDIKLIHQKFKPHDHTHHVVIIALLILCYSILSYVTLSFYYHASELALQIVRDTEYKATWQNSEN